MAKVADEVVLNHAHPYSAYDVRSCHHHGAYCCHCHRVYCFSRAGVDGASCRVSTLTCLCGYDVSYVYCLSRLNYQSESQKSVFCVDGDCVYYSSDDATSQHVVLYHCEGLMQSYCHPCSLVVIPDLLRRRIGVILTFILHVVLVFQP